MRIGSEEHKALFCGTFIASHRVYEPAELPWPELDETHLERLRAIPFWKIAIGVEQNAGRMVSGFAETIRDPLLREAVALQGMEETRHAALLSVMIERYNLRVDPPALPKHAPTKAAFTVFGYEECLDSYFGFGLFGIASRMQYMPEPLLAIFEPILEEEARHIVFFVNWVAYARARAGVAGLGFLLSAYGYLRALGRLAATASGASEGTGFLAPAAGAGGTPQMTFREFLESCDSENRRYMNAFDPRLLRPQVVPAIAAAVLMLLSRRQVAAGTAP